MLLMERMEEGRKEEREDGGKGGMEDGGMGGWRKGRTEERAVDRRLIR